MKQGVFWGALLGILAMGAVIYCCFYFKPWTKKAGPGTAVVVPTGESPAAGNGQESGGQAGYWELADCAYTSEQKDGLFPFRDLNDVIRISAGNDGIKFYSANGIRVYSHGRWSFGVTRQEYPSRYGNGPEETRLPKYQDIKLPDWYIKWTYAEAVAQYRLGNEEFILVRNADEGAVCTCVDIIDVSGGKVYRLEACVAGVLYVDATDIWIGHARGLIRIDRKTGRRTNIYTLPRFTEIRGVTEHAGIRYVATDDAFLAVDAAGSIEQLEIPADILARALPDHEQARDRVSPDVFATPNNTVPKMSYTNPVVWEDLLYVGAVPISEEGGYATGRSLLLSYDPAAGTWSGRELGEHFGLHRLVLHGGRLWCFGHWYEWYEGGDYSFWGGLAVLDKNGNLTQIPALEGVPIGGYRFEADGLAVSTYKKFESGLTYFSPGEMHEPDDLTKSNYICRLSLDTLEVIGYEKLGDEASVPAGFNQVELDREAARQQVEGWFVRLRVVEVPGEAPLVLTRADFEGYRASAGG
ncbi:MAG: hypothetical protein K6U03_03950 [Firmicutes bacterium]|nr:hypothetical protein [Bacillota bacterium]